MIYQLFVRRLGSSAIALWLLAMTIPLIGLWLLISQPSLDGHWEHHVSHFWLVLGAALVSVAIAVRMSEQTRRRADIRLFLVSMAFLSSAGFLGLHALATPGVLLDGTNAGFEIATPVGLLLGAVFAAASSIEFTATEEAAVLRRQALIRAGLVLVVAVWATASLLSWPPLDRPVGATEAHGTLVILALVGAVLYGVASARYLLVYRRRPSPVLLSVVTAFLLLTEAMVAVGFARNWHASWWEWHVLMAAGFGFVAYSATAQRRREGSAAGLFNSITSQQTVRAVRAEYGDALEELVGVVGRQRDTGGHETIGVLAARVGARHEMTERQVEVLERAAQTVVTERLQAQQLEALVAVGQEASIIGEESDLVDRATSLITTAFAPDTIRIGLVDKGRLRGVSDGWGPLSPAVDSALERVEVVEARGAGVSTTLALPLVVKGRAAGVVEVNRSGDFAEHDRFVLRSLANQLSIAVENARLYRQIEGLFRQYMSPDVATALLADPGQASLGGAVLEVTVLMADLRGFTPFSERTAPDQVVAMLNRYFGIAVPLILEQGGTVVQFVGDAVMALFNAPARQPDHALRAARAGLFMQEAIEAVAADLPGWPRFRVGINTGPALVGNIGSDEFRNFTAIGDTTNLAARLETSAEVGQVVIGPSTYSHICDVATVDPLGPLHLKGKELPIEAFVLRSLRTES